VDFEPSRCISDNTVFHRSLKLREKVLGPNHPYVAYSLNNLGNLYAKIKNFTSALPVYLRVLQIAIDVFGAGNPFVAQTKYSTLTEYLRGGRHLIVSADIGKMLVKDNKVASGRDYLNQALVLALKVYNHRHVLVKKIAGKILDSHSYESEKQLLARVTGVIHSTVQFGLSSGVLAWQEGNIVAVPARAVVTTATTTRYVVTSPCNTKAESDRCCSQSRWQPRIIRKDEKEAIEAATFAKLFGHVTTRDQSVDNAPSESSDEDKEECAVESSDEDCGFGLFD